MNKDIKINYVLASWGGNRAAHYPAVTSRKENYLKFHLQKLKELKHNLSQITICKPHCEEKNNYYSCLSDISENTVIMEGKNECLSYGQFCKSFDKHREQFQYYIFIEDDYVPCLNNFDEKLVEMYAELRKKDEINSIYLCGLMDYRFGIPVAAIPHGITDSHSLSKVFKGRTIKEVLDQVEGVNGRENLKGHHQINFSTLFDSIKEYRDRYSSYYHYVNVLNNYSSVKDSHIIVPYEFFMKKDIVKREGVQKKMHGLKK